MSKYKIRKNHGLLPWQIITPGGTWFQSPTHAHAIEMVDHLLGHHRAHKRTEEGKH
ncbi:MAG: hypothetical protein J2P17_06170 [Mycobacterium sp.]|nr:hypothetical protein [Mycobacterium sp.]